MNTRNLDGSLEELIIGLSQGIDGAKFAAECQDLHQAFLADDSSREVWAGPIAIQFEKKESIAVTICRIAEQNGAQVGAIKLIIAGIAHWMSFGGCTDTPSSNIARLIVQVAAGSNLDYILQILELIGADLLMHISWQEQPSVFLANIVDVPVHRIQGFLEGRREFLNLCNFIQSGSMTNPLRVLNAVAEWARSEKGEKSQPSSPPQWLSLLDWFKTADQVCIAILSDPLAQSQKGRVEYLSVAKANLSESLAVSNRELPLVKLSRNYMTDFLKKAEFNFGDDKPVLRASEINHLASRITGFPASQFSAKENDSIAKLYKHRGFLRGIKHGADSMKQTGSQFALHDSVPNVALAFQRICVARGILSEILGKDAMRRIPASLSRLVKILTFGFQDIETAMSESNNFGPPERDNVHRMILEALWLVLGQGDIRNAKHFCTRGAIAIQVAGYLIVPRWMTMDPANHEGGVFAIRRAGPSRARLCAYYTGETPMSVQPSSYSTFDGVERDMIGEILGTIVAIQPLPKQHSLEVALILQQHGESRLAPMRRDLRLTHGAWLVQPPLRLSTRHPTDLCAISVVADASIQVAGKDKILLSFRNRSARLFGAMMSEKALVLESPGEWKWKTRGEMKYRNLTLAELAMGHTGTAGNTTDMYLLKDTTFLID